MPLIVTPEIREKLRKTPKHLRTHLTVMEELNRASAENTEKFREFNKQSSQHLYLPQIIKLVNSMNDLVAAMKLLPSEDIIEKQIESSEDQIAKKAEIHLQRLFACETVEHVEKHIWPVLLPAPGEIIDLQFFPKTIDLLEETNRVFIRLIKNESNIDVKKVDKLFTEVTENHDVIKSQYNPLLEKYSVKPIKEKVLLFAAIATAAIAFLSLASILLLSSWPLMLGVLMIGVVIASVAAVIYLKHQSEKDKRLSVVPELKRNNKMYQLHKSTLFRAKDVRDLLSLPTTDKNCSREASPAL